MREFWIHCRVMVSHIVKLSGRGPSWEGLSCQEIGHASREEPTRSPTMARPTTDLLGLPTFVFSFTFWLFSTQGPVHGKQLWCKTWHWSASMQAVSLLLGRGLSPWGLKLVGRRWYGGWFCLGEWLLIVGRPPSIPNYCRLTFQSFCIVFFWSIFFILVLGNVQLFILLRWS